MSLFPVPARAADVFGGTKPTSDMPDLNPLHAKIGQLALEEAPLKNEDMLSNQPGAPLLPLD